MLKPCIPEIVVFNSDEALETELRIIKDNIQQLVGAIKAADLFVDLDSKEKTVEPTSTKEKPTVTDKNK